MINEKIYLLKNPIAGFLSIAFGLLIINSGLNVHSGEIFLWLIGILVFLLLLPIILFLKSLQVMRLMAKQADTKIRTVSIILTAALGLLWISLIMAAFLKDW